MTVTTDQGVRLRIPGNIIRHIDPSTFDFPTLDLNIDGTSAGTSFLVSAPVDGIGALYLLDTIDADADDVHDAVNAFNADPFNGWLVLLHRYFTEARQECADRRAAIQAEEEELIAMEAGFLR